MKNIISMSAGIIFIVGLFVALNVDLLIKWNNHHNERKYYNQAYEIASSHLDTITYGNDWKTNKILALKAGAEKWSFTRQEGFSLIETGDPNTPFIVSGEYIFTNPENKNHRHYLRDVYIFDYGHTEWIPLYSSLWEFKDGESRLMADYSIWQGDYETPFFDK